MLDSCEERNIFVNKRLEFEWIDFQKKLENTFCGEFPTSPYHEKETSRLHGDPKNHRNLKIEYDTFIEYFFIEEPLLEKYEEDIVIDSKYKTIKISDCRIIPILGILKMLHDYRDG
jgi:hypothetical protein